MKQECCPKTILAREVANQIKTVGDRHFDSISAIERILRSVTRMVNEMNCCCTGKDEERCGKHET